jgi:hypothetical protein
MAGAKAPGTQGRQSPGPVTPVAAPSRPARRPAADYWRHDPRLDPPTKKDRRRLLAWVAFLAVTPVCLGVVVWAAVGLNGSYPTVRSAVPSGWQEVPGIYASFSAPKSWSLQQFMSDSAGDIYYSGPGGGVGESVTQASYAPNPGVVPPIVATFLVDRYQISSRRPFRLRDASEAWEYQFRLTGGGSAIGVLAWVKPTQSVVWLVVSPVSATTEKVLSTLAVAD